MATERGIAITIKGFLPMTDDIDNQLEVLTAVKEAHESQDYSKVLEKMNVEQVRSEQKTRRKPETADSQEQKEPEPELVD
jgi:hypothetical protein